MKDKKRIVLGTRSLPKNIQEEQDYISRGSIYVSHATTMYRRDLALEIGGYREFFRFGSEDHDFFARLGAKTQITNLQEILLWCRINAPTSVFRQSNFPDGKNYMYRTILCILKAIWNSIRRLWT